MEAHSTKPASTAFERLQARCEEKNTLLCVGIDPSTDTLSTFEARLRVASTAQVPTGLELMEKFCDSIVDATAEHVCAFKPNSAFFEAAGPSGLTILERLCNRIRSAGIPLILDVKRGDIGSTAAAYADAAYKVFQADLVTVNPYMGMDAVRPFIDGAYEDRGAFVLCKTSNPTAKELQDLKTQDSDHLYTAVVKMCKNNCRSGSSSVGFVVGATQIDAVTNVRAMCDEFILAPGVGAQGGNLEEVVAAGIRADGFGIIIPISRAIAEAQVRQTRKPRGVLAESVLNHDTQDGRGSFVKAGGD